MDHQAIFQQVENEFKCACLETLLVHRLCVDGRKQFMRQCQRCGRCSKILPLGSLPAKEMALAMPLNQKLQDDWRERRTERLNQLQKSARDRESEAWWKDYNAYLDSPKWAEKRQRVLERDNYLCQACRTRKATQVHHLSYKHVKREPLFELVSVCDVCHVFITQMDRGELPEQLAKEFEQ